MKILVLPNEVGLGGSQLNAIELGAAVRDLGHEVVVLGEPGVLVERIDAGTHDTPQGVVDQAHTPAQLAGLVHSRTREALSTGESTKRRDRR